MAQSHRFMLLFLALIIMSFNRFSSHTVSAHRKNQLYFTNCSAPVLIRLRGGLIEPGVYEVPAGSTVASVLYRLNVKTVQRAQDTPLFCTRLTNGDVLDVAAGGGLSVGIERMSANEQMVLGIPLDPDQMGLEDWLAVPGIGLHTAKRIIDDRRAYGPFHSIEGLARVPGIGSGKFAAFKKYF